MVSRSFNFVAVLSRGCRLGAVALGGLLFFAHGNLQGQEDVDLIPDEVSCSACEIRIGLPELVLGSALPDGGFSSRPHLTLDSEGRFWLLPRSRWWDPPVVLDASGAILARLGREGEGPGEFRSPDLTVPLGSGEVLILDSRLARASLFGSDFTFRHSWPIPPFPQDAVLLPNDEIVVAATPSDPALVGSLLHRFGADGEYLGPFGDRSETVLPGRSLFRILAHSRSGVWVGTRIGAYRIEHHGMQGEVEVTFSRRPAWFTAPAATDLPGGWFPPPQPGIRAVHEDEAGYLWILLTVADERWREAVDIPDGRPGDERAAAATEIMDYDVWLDSWIEVIDPIQGRVVSRARFDRSFDGFLQDGRLYRSVRSPETGVITVEILPVGLTGRRSPDEP